MTPSLRLRPPPLVTLATWAAAVGLAGLAACAAPSAAPSAASPAAPPSSTAAAPAPSTAAATPYAGQQGRDIKALFASMQHEVSVLGARLVDEERALDAAFATKRADAAQLADATKRIGALQAELRRVHLDAHLAQARILTPAQAARYVELRGYGAAAAQGAHGGHRHRH